MSNTQPAPCCPSDEAGTLFLSLFDSNTLPLARDVASIVGGCDTSWDRSTNIAEDGAAVGLGDCFSSGDYGGNGSLGIANRRVLLERLPLLAELGLLVEASGVYNSDWMEAARVLFLADWDANAEVIRYGFEHEIGMTPESWDDVLAERNELVELLQGLQDYPLLDDEAHSEVEEERKEEAWESYARDDTRKALGLLLGMPDTIEDLTDEQLDSLRDNARHLETGSEWVDEYGGMALDCDAYAQLIAELPELMEYVATLAPAQYDVDDAEDAAGLAEGTLLAKVGTMVGPGRWRVAGYLDESMMTQGGGARKSTVPGPVKAGQGLQVLLAGEGGKVSEGGEVAEYRLAPLSCLDTPADHPGQSVAF